MTHKKKEKKNSLSTHLKLTVFDGFYFGAFFDHFVSFGLLQGFQPLCRVDSCGFFLRLSFFGKFTSYFCERLSQGGLVSQHCSQSIKLGGCAPHLRDVIRGLRVDGVSLISSDLFILVDAVTWIRPAGSPNFG